MAKTGDPLLPACEEKEAVEIAVKRILQAASDLCLAADLADEGDVVSHYINAAIHLRDLANSLYPDKPDWPKGGADIIDFRTKQKVN
jgi:hypothetical protein